LLNDSAGFLGLTFASTDCPSHHSLIPIQRSKNKNLKTKISQITNPFSYVFIYKKRDKEEGRERDRERKKRGERHKI
jgi:hypothetical protein